jgi:hypothetical protein
MEGDKKCKFCLESESADHLLFRCPLSVYIWVVARGVLGWKALLNGVKSFVENFMYTRGTSGMEI